MEYNSLYDICLDILKALDNADILIGKSSRMNMSVVGDDISFSFVESVAEGDYFKGEFYVNNMLAGTYDCRFVKNSDTNLLEGALMVESESFSHQVWAIVNTGGTTWTIK